MKLQPKITTVQLQRFELELDEETIASLLRQAGLDPAAGAAFVVKDAAGYWTPFTAVGVSWTTETPAPSPAARRRS